MAKDEGMELVSVEKSGPTISIDGWDASDKDLASLLEKAAGYLRNAAVKETVGRDLTFKQVETGDVFVVTHRS